MRCVPQYSERAGPPSWRSCTKHTIIQTTTCTYTVIYLTIRRRVDWCCVPQYSGGTMVEVLRSKLFYARARIMVVLPTFHELPKVRELGLCVTTQQVVVGLCAPVASWWCCPPSTSCPRCVS